MFKRITVNSFTYFTVQMTIRERYDNNYKDFLTLQEWCAQTKSEDLQHVKNTFAAYKIDSTTIIGCRVLYY